MQCGTVLNMGDMGESSGGTLVCVRDIGHQLNHQTATGVVFSGSDADLLAELGNRKTRPAAVGAHLIGSTFVAYWAVDNDGRWNRAYLVDGREMERTSDGGWFEVERYDLV